MKTEAGSPNVEEISIVGLFVQCICNDGMIRPVVLTGKQPKQILGYVRHIQGGRLQLKREPIGKLELEKEAA